MKPQLHVLYTENGIIKLKSFDIEANRLNWIGEFTVEHLDDPTDNQIDLLFSGAVESVGTGVVQIEF